MDEIVLGGPGYDIRILTEIRYMLSQKAKYAFRALFALAEAGTGEPLQISDIADGQRIPKKFLEQILLDLKHRGYLSSRRGKNGGYALLRDPAEITFGEIVRAIDGPMAPLPCLSRTAYQRCDDCVGEEVCPLRGIFGRAYEASLAILERETLADALADGRTRSALA
jgi:Rrf2 family protein